MMTDIKTYSELIMLPTFLDRFNYLKIGGEVGKTTFGHERYLNQILYNSHEWKRFRRDMVLRDNGMDLACDEPEYEIFGKIIVHHIDPITIDDVLKRHPKIFDPENVVCTSMNTHNAIHYGDETLVKIDYVERRPNDTCPWLW